MATTADIPQTNNQVQDLSSSTDSLFITSPTLSVSSLSSSGFDFVQTPRTRTRNTIGDSDDEIVWSVSENEDLDIEYEGLSSSTGGLLSDDDFVVLSRAMSPLSLIETQTQTQTQTIRNPAPTFDANTITTTTTTTNIATTNTNITADSMDTGTIRRKRSLVGLNTESVSLVDILTGPTSGQSQEHVDDVDTKTGTSNGTEPLILDLANSNSVIEKKKKVSTELVDELAKLSLDVGFHGNACAVETSGTMTPVKKESPVGSGTSTRKEKRKEKKEKRDKEGERTLVTGEDEQVTVKDMKKRKKEKTISAEGEEKVDAEKERKKAKIETSEDGGGDKVVMKEKKKKEKGKSKEQKEQDIATFSALEAAVLSAPTLKSSPALSKSISTATLVPSPSFGTVDPPSSISASYPELELAATVKGDEEPVVFSLTPKVRPLPILPSLPPPPSQDVNMTTTLAPKKPKSKKKGKKEKTRSILNDNNDIISPGNNTNTIIAEKVSEQTPSHYDEAVSYITSYISNPVAHQDRNCQLTLLQSLIVELGLISNLDQLPLTIKSAKKFLKSHAFLNIKEYITRRHEGPEVVRGLLFSSRWALIKDMRKGKKKCPLSWVKKRGLQVLLVSVFH